MICYYYPPFPSTSSHVRWEEKVLGTKIGMEIRLWKLEIWQVDIFYTYPRTLKLKFKNSYHKKKNAKFFS